MGGGGTASFRGICEGEDVAEEGADLGVAGKHLAEVVIAPLLSITARGTMENDRGRESIL